MPLLDEGSEAGRSALGFQASYL
ncbi:hypothetical protein FOXYSP1_18190 [Fusarium oxysporum f. sp. phaseoli]